MRQYDATSDRAPSDATPRQCRYPGVCVASDLTDDARAPSLPVMAKKRDGKRLELCKRIQKEFGQRFRKARISSCRLQKNIAFEMNLTRTTVSNIERGTQRLYLDQVFQAAHVFGVNLGELLPSVADVFLRPDISTATDAPLPVEASAEAQRIISGLLVTSSPRVRRRSSSPVAE